MDVLGALAWDPFILRAPIRLNAPRSARLGCWRVTCIPQSEVLPQLGGKKEDVGGNLSVWRARSFRECGAPLDWTAVEDAALPAQPCSTVGALC